MRLHEKKRFQEPGITYRGKVNRKIKTTNEARKKCSVWPITDHW